MTAHPAIWAEGMYLVLSKHADSNEYRGNQERFKGRYRMMYGGGSENRLWCRARDEGGDEEDSGEKSSQIIRNMPRVHQRGTA